MMRRIVSIVGACVSGGLGYAALRISGLTSLAETNIPALLLGLAVLVICVSSYRSGVRAETTT